jgi:hypothetical protein
MLPNNQALRAMTLFVGLLFLSSPIFAQNTGGPAGKAPPKLVLFMVIDGFPQEQFVKYYDQSASAGRATQRLRRSSSPLRVTSRPIPRRPARVIRPPRSPVASCEAARCMSTQEKLRSDDFANPMPTVPSAPIGSKHPETSAFCGPVATSSGSSLSLLAEAENRTTRVLPNRTTRVLSTDDYLLS